MLHLRQRAQRARYVLLERVRRVLVHAEHRQGELCADRCGRRGARRLRRRRLLALLLLTPLQITIRRDDRLHQAGRGVAVQILRALD